MKHIAFLIIVLVALAGCTALQAADNETTTEPQIQCQWKDTEFQFTAERKTETGEVKPIKSLPVQVLICSDPNYAWHGMVRFNMLFNQQANKPKE